MRHPRCVYSFVKFLVLASSLAMFACQKTSSPPTEREAASSIVVTVNPGGPAAIRTARAEFEILPSGYVQGYLLKDGKRLTLDDPGGATPESVNSIVASGEKLADFTLDFDHVRVSAARGKIGERGERVEITGRSKAKSGASVEESLVFEAYDNFPRLLATSASYKNHGNKPLILEKVVVNRHRLNASLADPSAATYQLWPFHGSSEKWGKDDRKSWTISPGRT